MKNLASLLCLLAFLTFAHAQGYKPPSGYVPDSATAIAIAKAVLVPVFGKKAIESEKPFRAKLQSDIWTVTGTLSCPDGKGGVTTVCFGGAAVVEISKIDGHIISMSHGK
jgi:NTF2 fold immunity protein